VLISRRKVGETLLIGDEIELRIISVRKKRVILGIIAPRDIRIAAMKLSDAEMANTMAAANSIDIDQFFHAPSGEEEQVLFLLEESKTPEMADKDYGRL
jgi:carbon storage regulator